MEVLFGEPEAERSGRKNEAEADEVNERAAVIWLGWSGLRARRRELDGEQ